MARRIRKLTLVGCWLLWWNHIAAEARPSYQLDAEKRQVIALFNLSPSPDCHPDRSSGRVVARSFNAQGTLLQGFTIESPNGQRSYINVDVEELQNLDMVTLQYVQSGLQTLVRDGHEIDMGTKLCGAAGRVEMLDAIYSSRAPRPVVTREPSPQVSTAPSAPPMTETAKFRWPSSFALAAATAVFLVGAIVVRQVPAQGIAARIVVGVIVTVVSSAVLYVLGIKDELTLLAVAALGGIIVVSVSVLF